MALGTAASNLNAQNISPEEQKRILNQIYLDRMKNSKDTAYNPTQAAAFEQNLANKDTILAGLQQPANTQANNNVGMGGTTAGTNTAGGGVKAPTFDANAYYNNGAGGINNIVDKRKELQLAQLKASKDKAEADINFQKGKLPGQYQPLRDDTDFQSKVAALKLKEMMGEKGLLNSGTNVTGQMRINAANINALNTLNAQQQSQVDEFDRRIADIRNPADENAMAGQFELERLQLLNDLQTRADDRAYDNSWKTADFDYRTGRDAVADNQWQTQFDYGKSRDAIGDKQWQTTFDADQQWRNVDNGWKAREWNHGLDREKVEDSRYKDETAYNRRMDAIKLAKASSGGGRHSSGGGSSTTGKYDEQQIGTEYINTVLGTRSNKQNAQEQFNRDKAALAALGMSPKEIAYIQKQINGLKDDWVGPGYNSNNAPKNPLAGFWTTFNPNYKYVK